MPAYVDNGRIVAVFELQTAAKQFVKITRSHRDGRSVQLSTTRVELTLYTIVQYNLNNTHVPSIPTKPAIVNPIPAITFAG